MSITKYTKEHFAIRVRLLRDELVSHGFDVRDIADIGFFKSCVTLGKCRRFGVSKADLFFSDILLELFYDSVGYETCKEVILHELIHATADSGIGHGEKFMCLAKQVNRLFGTSIGTHCDDSTFAAVRKASISLGRYKYRVFCDCGAVNEYKTRVCSMTRNPELYRCSACGMTLHVEDLASSC